MLEAKEQQMSTAAWDMTYSRVPPRLAGREEPLSDH